MPVEIIGLPEIAKNFQKFSFTQRRAKERYFDLIGNSSLQLLRGNTPRDTGALARSWQILGRGGDWLDVGVPPDQYDKLYYLTNGTRTQTPNLFVSVIGSFIDNQIISTLELSLKESHIFFNRLPGGRGRSRQQVGRTSAGFSGGKRATGTATVKRTGTGSKRLGRRLSLRRRRGRTINATRKDIKMG